MRNRMHQSAIVLVRCVPSLSPTAAILEKTLGTRLSQYLCRARPRAVWVPHLKKFKAFLASSFVRGVLRSTTASVYKLFIRRFLRIQGS